MTSFQRSLFYRAVVPLSLLIATVLGLAEGPAWWTTRNVLIPGKAIDDFAVLNQGQLKHLAKAAHDEMQANLSGGAGAAIESMVQGWQTG